MAVCGIAVSVCLALEYRLKENTYNVGHSGDHQLLPSGVCLLLYQDQRHTAQPSVATLNKSRQISWAGQDTTLPRP